MRPKFDFNLFRAMEVFVAVAETRQVTSAAHLLGVTQSAASQHLRNLERALDAPLFDRSSRPLQLTRAGVSLYRRAGRILNEIEDLTADLRRLGDFPIPVLRIGILASIATTLTEPLVSLARDRFSIPEIVMHAGLATDHQALLRMRRADLVITSDPFYDLEGLERHAVLREPFLLAVPGSYKGPTEDLSSLARELPLVRFVVDTPVGRRTDQHLRRVRLELPRTIEADRSSMVMAAVAAGRGFAILTPTLLLDGLAEGMPIKVRPLPIAGFHREITVLGRERELGGLPAAFAKEAARSLLQTIAQAHPALAVHMDTDQLTNGHDRTDS